MVFRGTHEAVPELVERATAMVETEDMIADSTPDVMEHRKLDLALHLTDQYFGLLSHWAWERFGAGMDPPV